MREVCTDDDPCDAGLSCANDAALDSLCNAFPCCLPLGSEGNPCNDLIDSTSNGTCDAGLGCVHDPVACADFGLNVCCLHAGGEPAAPSE